MPRVLLVIAFVILAAPAFAQTAAPSPEEMSINVNWQNLQTSVIALLQANKAHADESAALKQRLTDLDAYLKACGDAVGCTVPAK